MKSLRQITVTLAMLGLAAPAVRAGDVPDSSRFGDVAYLEGTWNGFGKGRWGNSLVNRSYEFVLDGSFLMARNKSVYEPQEKNPEGEIHENWDFISYDTERETLVLRQFHNEYIVNTFVLDSASADRQILYFTTEHIENFMPGWRARLTIARLGPDSFKELFELAAPDQDFEVFLENKFIRK
jgi:hypothetical protein